MSVKTAGKIMTDLFTGSLFNMADSFVDTEGNLLESKLPVLWQYLNDGLTRIYTTHRLKVDEVFLASYEGRSEYPITSEHFMAEMDAFIGSSSYEKYLYKRIDQPWQNDLIQILQVTDHLGQILPMNDSNDPRSVFTPQYNVLQIPIHPDRQYAQYWDSNKGKMISPSNPLEEGYDQRQHGMVYTVQYQCRHPEIVNQEDEVTLPDHLWDALYSYIAYKFYSAMNSDSAPGMFQEYQLRLQELKSESLVQPESSLLDTRFNDRGFI